MADEAIAWLSQYADEPFAMLLDFMDPHVPHTLWGEEERPPPERLGRQALVDTYDDDVAFTDDQLGRVLDALRRLGLYDRALIVFFSDHGEELRERGHLGHGHSRFEEIIRVPLVVKLPGSRLAGRRVDAVVRNLDIAPTVLAVLGLEAPRSFRGENLLALLDASQAAHGRVALTESEHTFSPNEKISARDRTHKLVYDVQTGEERLYDLEKDPGETRDVSERERERVAALRPSVYALFLEKFPGLHLACRSSRPVTVKGRVAFREPVVRRVKRVFFEEDDRTVVRDQRVVDFRFDLSDGFDALLLDGPGAGAGARVGLRARGRRVPARRVALGESGDAPASVPWEIGDLRDLAITRYDEAAHRALASEEGLRCFFWATRLEDAGAETPQPDAAEPLDAELREQLRILGYGE